MNSFEIRPAVDETQEFIEIANDFSNPLDLVREAISNSYDAKASKIKICFDVVKKYGESVLKIEISDNGAGMTSEQLQNFFDLGNSTRRDDIESIGEKGHGTKVYFNSEKIEVETSDGSNGLHATMDSPFRKLFDREIPVAHVVSKEGVKKGTKIVVWGYNNNRRDKFTHDILKDYISWFTKHGSVENQFFDFKTPVTLELKGLGEEEFETIQQGHYFPEDSKDINKLFEEHLVKAPDHYSKRIVRTGSLKNYPEIRFNAIFCVEGKYRKYSYNAMLRRPGYSAPTGAYTIQERYGLWVCKDFIPIQRKNEWITFKGSEYTKFHAFINCQALRLTANRGSIDNTPSEVLQDLQQEVKKIYEEIIKSDEWTSLEWLEDEAQAYQTTEKEKKNFEWRIKKVNRSNVAVYEGLTLVEPERESGVFSIFILLEQKRPGLFPFHVVDYDTHEGIDVIAKGDKKTPISSARLFYVEFKRTLTGNFNHSFENLHSIVCWESDIKHDDVLKDVNGEERKMQIIAPDSNESYTKYFLDNPKKAHKIEVFCLKWYLKEILDIEFTPRTSDSVV
ncbi:ATP-binding protein [Marinobacterium sp. AK62]|uniref:ATP-binding protein n=1 Tax=Marinobacterium alkalitolerans TaxID=1542925 RepID=A0ABS3ZBI1_9GAMM|nr:ATP-binding protein [Marinobacterium alkalitolerans]MBP0049062.1 ATP-binding protein [Marinobacterium alkalitolerans]